MESANDLDKALIGVQLGTASDNQATKIEERGEGATVVRFTKAADAIQALTQGKLDCIVEEELPARAFIKANPTLKMLPDTLDHYDMAICVAKDNEALLQNINRALEHLQRDGVIDDIIAAHVEDNQHVAYTPLTNLKRKGVLRFATNATFKPFEYYEDNKMVGIDVDIAHALCDELGMEAQMVDMEFDAIITSVQTGKADAGIAGITVSEDRKKNINFTIPYKVATQRIIVNTGSTVSDNQTIAERFKACFIDGHHYRYLFTGLKNTIVITVLACILSLLLGTIIAVIRSTHERNGSMKILNAVCQVYLAIVRGTPSMVQLLIIYYVIFASVNVDKVLVAVIAFGLNSAAYMAEIVRSGIMAVDQGQMEAGRSLGLSYGKTMRFIILPQAIKNALPAMGNELITMLKDTSISGYIGLVDLTKGSDIIRSVTYDAMMPLGIVACIYFALVVALSMGVSRMEKHLRKSERKNNYNK